MRGTVDAWHTGPMNEPVTCRGHESESEPVTPRRDESGSMGRDARGQGRTPERRWKLDALAKLGLLLAYSIALFVAVTPLALGMLAVVLAVAAAMARVSLLRVARTAAPVYLIAAFLLAYNVAASGWVAGVLVAARIVLLTWASIVMVRASNDAELADALRRLLAPLGHWGLPVHDFATALTLALRFMPLMAEELAAVRAAQASRGASFSGEGPVAALRAYGGLMVPVLVGLFRRADRLAAAMDARCFGASERPTSLTDAVFTVRDGIVLVGGAALCLALALGC